MCIFAIDMELKSDAIETLIKSVLTDINQKGYSSVQPFSIGKVEERMMQFANSNAITLASDELYMSAKQLQHSMRASKATKGLVVTDADLIGFPQNRFQMDLYYDGECFIYSDGVSKFIVHPNYKMKARSNCSSSLHCCSHATVPHIVALLGFSFHAANISTFSDNSKSFR